MEPCFRKKHLDVLKKKKKMRKNSALPTSYWLESQCRNQSWSLWWQSILPLNEYSSQLISFHLITTTALTFAMFIKRRGEYGRLHPLFGHDKYRQKILRILLTHNWRKYRVFLKLAFRFLSTCVALAQETNIHPVLFVWFFELHWGSCLTRFPGTLHQENGRFQLITRINI